MSNVAQGSKPPNVTARAPTFLEKTTVVGRATAWSQKNLFSSWRSTAITLILAYLLARGMIAFFDWGLLHAVWTAPNNDSSACRAIHGVGACWAVVTEKTRFILFGPYP